MNKRVVIIVLDSVGVGELPDADQYGDKGSNTLGNISQAVNGLSLPNLEKLGLGNIIDVVGVSPTKDATAAWGKMSEQSVGKDTTTGHWEIAGLPLKKPFPTYPNGFPTSLIKQYEELIGREIIGNYPASGTEILKELGKEHVETGKPIVYTSADSVFQIAAHESIVPIELLYDWCAKARALLQGEHGVGRVIARPFEGPEGAFTRTTNRRDFSMPPTGRIVFQALEEHGIPVYAVGKINDIYAGVGIHKSLKSKNNTQTIDQTINCLQQTVGESCLIFANCVDFDMLWGHRNDPVGYAQGLEEFDMRLPEIIEHLKEEDILVIMADHGCDPTTESTDHSREYVPLMVYGAKISPSALGTRNSFADVAASLCWVFGISEQFPGVEFLSQIIRG